MSLHGMRPPPRSVTSLESTSAAVLVPGGGELVLPTDNSMLQFWDVAREHHVDKLQVWDLRHHHMPAVIMPYWHCS